MGQDKNGRVPRMRGSKLALVVGIGALCALAVACLLLYSSDESVEADYDVGETSQETLVIESEYGTVEYSPGEYGSVVVDGDYAEYEDGSSKWVAGELLVVFDADTSDETIEGIAEEVSAELELMSQYEGSEYRTASFMFEDAQLDPLIASYNIMEWYEEVVYAGANNVGSLQSDSVTTDDTYLDKQSYLELSCFDEAWGSVKCENAVTVAVLDSGIEMSHPDLSSQIETEYAYDAIEREALGSGYEDTCGHGTFVAGIVAATANSNQGIAGCSYNARILPIRVADDEGNVEVKDVGEALTYILSLEDKPDVINMSFCFSLNITTVYRNWVYEYVCEASVETLAESYGVVAVAAAGNYGEADSPSVYPADSNYVIGVGSVDGEKQHSTFSSANQTVDICAQGESVFSTISSGSDYVGYGGTQYGDSIGGYTLDGEYTESPVEGTSFAAPQVAAVIALLKSMDIEWDYATITVCLFGSAEDLGTLDYDEEYGYGLLDAAAAVESASVMLQADDDDGNGDNGSSGNSDSGGGSSGGGSSSPSTGGSVRELLFGETDAS